MFHGKRVLPNMKLGDICPSVRHVPELSMGLARGAASGSLISTTTTSDVRKVLATEAACSRQHLTTCMQFIVVRKRMFFLFISTQFIHTKQGVKKKEPNHSVNSQPGAKLLLVLSCSSDGGSQTTCRQSRFIWVFFLSFGSSPNSLLLHFAVILS